MTLKCQFQCHPKRVIECYILHLITQPLFPVTFKLDISKYFWKGFLPPLWLTLPSSYFGNVLHWCWLDHTVSNEREGLMVKTISQENVCLTLLSRKDWSWIVNTIKWDFNVGQFLLTWTPLFHWSLLSCFYYLFLKPLHATSPFPPGHERPSFWALAHALGMIKRNFTSLWNLYILRLLLHFRTQRLLLLM